MKIIITVFIAACLVSCSGRKPVERMTAGELKEYAGDLAQRYIMVDGHIDFPTIMIERKIIPGRNNDLLVKYDSSEFDYARAKKGGLDAPFMSIYIPSACQRRPDKGKSFADTLINLVHGMTAQLPDKFAAANSPRDVVANSNAGKISLPMGMENGAPLGDDLKNVQYFFDRGIRYITLTHNKDNQIGDSSGDTTSTWKGLSPFGREVVREMNRVGIMVDISHVADSTFYQVLRLTKVPCIASHSDCRYFVPSSKRDMTDDMIMKMGKNGGVVMINFFTLFLDSAIGKQTQKMEEILAKKGLRYSDPAARPIYDKFRKDHPVDIETVTNHIEHVVQLIGIDHVGFGSDFDGVGGMLPLGLTDVSMYPDLIASLLRRGYTEKDIEKICGGNVMRVWDQVLEAAQR